jgi:GTP-binding protein
VQISAEFVTSAAGAGDFPRDRLMEVALVGRSNVGKSSLMNALVRRQLARTSAAPGKTRLANFYRVQRGSAPALYLVDLPGYGYARGGDASAREFNVLAEAYFSRASGDLSRPSAYGLRASVLEGSQASRHSSERDNVHGPKAEARRPKPDAKDIGVLLLVDSRHPGLESDLDTWDWLKTQPVARGIVATKVDKLTRAERARHTRELESSFEAPVLLVSAQSGEGLEELWKLIARLPKETAA